MMRRLLIAFAAVGAAGLPARPEIRVGALPPSVEFGQSVALPIVVTREAEERIEAIALGEGALSGPGAAERLSQTPLRDGRVREEWSLRAHAFEAGQIDLPAVTVRWADGAAASTEIIATDQSLLVASALDEADPLAPSRLRGPFRMRVPFPTALAVAVAVALAAALALWWLGRRMRRPCKQSRHLAPRVSPHEAALRALDALERSDLLERGLHREWFYRLTDTVKGYFEDEFGFPAREMTSGELLHALRVGEFPHTLCIDVEGWIGRCDLVKYARQEAGRELCHSAIALARAIVTEAHMHAEVDRRSQEAA